MRSIIKAAPIMGLIGLALSCQKDINFLEANLASPNASHNLAQSAPLRPENETTFSIKNILVFINYPDKDISCNGTIIGPFKIVTSAHCFFEGRDKAEWSSKIPIKIDQMTLRFLDKSSSQLKDASTLNTKYIKSVTIPPEMDTEVEHYKKIMAEAKSRDVKYPYWMAHDVALIELDRDLLIKEKPDSREASLAFEHFKGLPKDVELAPIGFDPTIAQHHENFEFLQYFSLSSFSRITQKSAHPDDQIEVRTLSAHRDLKWFKAFTTIYDHYILRTSMPLVRYPDQNGFLCHGDSGSPVFLYDKVKKNLLIIGIAQGAIVDHRFPNCASNSYFTSLPFHYKWLGISP